MLAVGHKRLGRLNDQMRLWGAGGRKSEAQNAKS